MHWTDHAVLLSVSKQGESGALVRLLTQQHGLQSGLVRGAFSKKNRGVYMPGNQVEARWSARLAEHLGSLQCEIVHPTAALLLDDPMRLAALSAACAMLCATLAERESHPALYEALVIFEILLLDPRATPEHLYALLALFELSLLKELGYALDLSSCAGTGATEQLIYISPKTGRAVSREAGAPYHSKLLPLPAFFLKNNSPFEERGRESENIIIKQSEEEGSLPRQLGRAGEELQSATFNTPNVLEEQTPWLAAIADFVNMPPPPLAECVDGVKVSGYFLEAWVFQPLGRKLPPARERFLQMFHFQPA